MLSKKVYNFKNYNKYEKIWILGSLAKKKLKGLCCEITAPWHSRVKKISSFLINEKNNFSKKGYNSSWNLYLCGRQSGNSHQQIWAILKPHEKISFFWIWTNNPLLNLKNELHFFERETQAFFTTWHMSSSENKLKKKAMPKIYKTVCPRKLRLKTHPLWT